MPAIAQKVPHEIALAYNVTRGGVSIAVIQERFEAREGAFRIETALGRIATVHLVKRREPGDSGAEVWLSPAHAHLPVKMLVIESDGARYEQAITRLDLRL